MIYFDTVLDAGDTRLFDGMKNAIETDVPTEMIEWKRNYGRASKNVVIRPKVVKFEPEEVSATSGVKSLLGQSILHTFWTECSVRNFNRFFCLLYHFISIVFCSKVPFRRLGKNTAFFSTSSFVQAIDSREQD